MIDEGLIDAVEAFFDAGKSGKYEEAAQAYMDMQKLSCEGEGSEEEEGGDMSGERGKPLSVLIDIAKKK